MSSMAGRQGSPSRSPPAPGTERGTQAGVEAEETGLGVMLMLSRGGSWGGCEGRAERVQGGGHEWGMGGGGGARAWGCVGCAVGRGCQHTGAGAVNSQQHPPCRLRSPWN